jgi:hypothetical protein
MDSAASSGAARSSGPMREITSSFKVSAELAKVRSSWQSMLWVTPWLLRFSNLQWTVTCSAEVWIDGRLSIPLSWAYPWTRQSAHYSGISYQRNIELIFNSN